MANVLSTGAWLFAPTKKPSIFGRLLRAFIEARERQAERVVEQYLAARGLKRIDDADHSVESLLFRTDRLP